jgi:hypothetical protein
LAGAFSFPVQAPMKLVTDICQLLAEQKDWRTCFNSQKWVITTLPFMREVMKKNRWTSCFACHPAEPLAVMTLLHLLCWQTPLRYLADDTQLTWPPYHCDITEQWMIELSVFLVRVSQCSMWMVNNEILWCLSKPTLVPTTRFELHNLVTLWRTGSCRSGCNMKAEFNTFPRLWIEPTVWTYIFN